MLWAFALQYYIECYKNFHVDDNDKTPLMKFSKLNDLPVDEDFHPFGCPVFVLESKLQSNTKGAPNWDPRARLGVYPGHSPSHAGSIALVLNPASGHVSPQYHVVLDDSFSTVSNLRNGTVPKNWKDLVQNSSYLSTDEDYDLANVWLCETTANPNSPVIANEIIQGQASASSPITASYGTVLEISEGAPSQLSEGGANFF